MVPTRNLPFSLPTPNDCVNKRDIKGIYINNSLMIPQSTIYSTILVLSVFVDDRTSLGRPQPLI